MQNESNKLTSEHKTFRKNKSQQKRCEAAVWTENYKGLAEPGVLKKRWQTESEKFWWFLELILVLSLWWKICWIKVKVDTKRITPEEIQMPQRQQPGGKL